MDVCILYNIFSTILEFENLCEFNWSVEVFEYIYKKQMESSTRSIVV